MSCSDAGPARKARRPAALLLLLFVALALAACGKVPQPFQPANKASPEVVTPGPASALVVHPITGREADSATLEKLTERLIERLRAAEIAAIRHDLPNRYSLAGESHLLRADSDAISVLLRWRLHDPAGRLVGEAEQSETVAESSWRDAEPLTLERIASRAATRVAALAGGRAAGTEPASPGRVGFLGVTGAPGDGDTELAQSMVHELRRLGVDVVDHRPTAGATVEGHVVMRIADETNDLVTVYWLVRDATGRERGRLTQQNTVTRGRLERRWGLVAGQVAAGAAPEIADLLQRLEAATTPPSPEPGT